MRELVYRQRNLLQYNPPAHARGLLTANTTTSGACMYIIQESNTMQGSHQALYSIMHQNVHERRVYSTSAPIQDN